MKFGLICLAVILISIVNVEAKSEGSKTAGRFQVVQISDFRRDQFLIDTETGRLWRPVCHGEVKDGACSGLNIWTEEVVEGLNITRDSVKKVLKETNEGK